MFCMHRRASPMGCTCPGVGRAEPKSSARAGVFRLIPGVSYDTNSELFLILSPSFATLRLILHAVSTALALALGVPCDKAACSILSFALHLRSVR